MVSSSAQSVEAYLDELSAERRVKLSKLRELVLASLPDGYKEEMDWGMICYQVPLSLSGPTYNKKPLASVAIASQKNYISIYLLGIYASDQLTQEFLERWQLSGKKLDMGKSCVRFKTLADADLETIAWACGLLNPSEFVSMYSAARANR